jgi:hypothetical protein
VAGTGALIFGVADGRIVEGRRGAAAGTEAVASSSPQEGVDDLVGRGAEGMLGGGGGLRIFANSSLGGVYAVP